ncbi:MAG TPA: hypothetical protein DCL44_08190, partial [Elusimicrobia bacterium]|nr:hypothetical protein [Elusimicrobiota bacterium]
MKIGIIMPCHTADRKSLIMPEVVRLLKEYGVQVEVICPEDHLNHLCHLRPVNDLYVLYPIQYN